jgi:trans-2,3-dihydro-3-hydroxyanthranilate isomerase
MAGSVKFNIVDVFTDRPFAGNELGVFTDARGLTTEQMQALARELNFSECTFVLPPEQGGDARIRIFTPEQELPFAGHPTLGTAFVLAAPMQLILIRVETGSGIVPVRLEREGARIIFGRMEQPIPRIEPFGRADDLIAALGVADVVTSLPIELYDNGVAHAYVELSSADAVARLEPDLTRLARFGHIGINCFAVDGVRVKTRCFVPTMGVPEDPATGSAAGPLALHLARHRRLHWGTEIEISQGVEIGRPSTLYARAEGSHDTVERVEVGGSAVVVARGEFRL